MALKTLETLSEVSLGKQSSLHLVVVLSASEFQLP